MVFLPSKIFNLKKLKASIYIALAISVGIYVYSLLFQPKQITPLTQSWEKVIPHQEVPQGLVGIKASDCGVCHQQHYAEWKKSTHALAWVDLQFQSELKKESSPFLCINCHIPLQNQQEFIVEGLEDGDIYKPVKKENPHFDYEMQQEGITCASCHVRDGKIIGKMGSTLAPHPVQVDSSHLSEKLCISCHNANAVVTPTLACTFQTGDEWKEGPYFGQQNCISCHMAEKTRPLAFGMPERLSHFHSFPGSGIPKLDTLMAEGLDGMAVYVNGATAINTGDSLIYSVKVVNEAAGHRLPTGDPERFYLIDMKFYDETGKLLHATQNRIGEKWQWHPEAKKLSDNNLNPKEGRRYTTGIKADKAGEVKVKVEVTKHRMDDKTAAYNKLGDNYPRFIYVYEKEFNVTVGK